MIPNNIRYLFNAETGIELIFCDNSTISYPRHNHISVLTIGIILEGSLILTNNQKTKVYGKMKHLPSYHMNHIVFQHMVAILCLAYALKKCGEHL